MHCGGATRRVRRALRVGVATPFQHTIRSIERGRGRPWLVAAGALALAAAWTVWVATASLPVHQSSASGRIESDAQSRPIQAPVSGAVVASQLVVGMRVAAGDELVELDSTPLQLELAERRAHLTGLEAVAATLDRTAASESQVVSQIEREGQLAVREAMNSLDGARSDVDLAKRESERAEALAREGLSSESDLDSAKTRSAALGATASAMRTHVDRLRAATQLQIGERSVKVQELDRERAAARSAVEVERSAIARLEHEIARRSVRAPVAGVIGAIGAVTQSSFLREGSEVAVLVPEGHLRAVAMFRSSSAGRLRAGQPVLLRFPAYPWTVYGSRHGRVARVASEAVDHMLRVEIELVASEPSAIPIQHGLEITAAVTIETISPARLLLRHAGAWLDSADGS